MESEIKGAINNFVLSFLFFITDGFVGGEHDRDFQTQRVVV